MVPSTSAQDPKTSKPGAALAASALLHPSWLVYMSHPPSSSSSSSSAQLIPNDDDHPSVVSIPAATATTVATLPLPPFHHLPIHCFLFPARPGRRSQLRNLVHALLTDVAATNTTIPPVLLPYLDQWLADDTTLLPAPLHTQLRLLAELARASTRIPQAVACQFWTDLHHVLITWRPPVQAQLAPSPPRPARLAQRSRRRRRKPSRRRPSSSTSPPTKRPRRSLSSSAPVPPSPSLVARFYSTIRGTISRLGTLFTPALPPPPPPRRGPLRAAKKPHP